MGLFRYAVVGAGWLMMPLAGSGTGTVTPVMTEAGAALSVTVVRDGTGEVFTKATPPDLVAPDVAGVTEFTVEDDEGNRLVATDGYFEARNVVVRNEGSFLSYIASLAMNLGIEREGASRRDDVELSRTASTEFTFEIVGGDMAISLGHDDEAAVGQSFEVEVLLSREDGTTVYLYPETHQDDNSTNARGLGTVLGPGVYTLLCEMKTQPLTADRIEQQFGFSITIGEEPDQIPFPAAGDFTHPLVVTEREGSGILEASLPVIVSETDPGNGRTQVLVRTAVANGGNSPWQDVQLELAPGVDGEPELTNLSLPPLFDLAPGETTAGTHDILIEVATGDLDALRPAILDGSRFRFYGGQQAVFAYPVQVLGAEDFVTPPEGSPAPTGLQSFPYAPLIPSGTIWLEWEPYYAEPLITQIIPPEGAGEAIIGWIQGRDGKLPAMVADVTRSGADFEVSFFDPGTGQPFGNPPIPLTSVMKEGLVVNELVFDGHPEGMGVTEVPETRQTGNGLSLAGFFPAPIPFHFNQLELSSGIEVSGSFGFRPKDLTVRVEMENFALKVLEVQADYTADANLLLETSEGADNTAEPVAMREATLLDIQLLDIQLSSGLRFTPRLVLESGASLSAPTSLSLPITAGLDISITAGVRDGEPYYDSQFTEIPLQLSDPGIYEALGASAEVYLDAEIKALLQASGSLVQSGPTLGARAQADFTVTPLLDPWWTLDAELSTFAGVELNLAGIINLVDAEHTLASWPLAPFFPLEADGPLAAFASPASIDPDPGFRPVGDARTRWIRSILPTSTGFSAGSTFAFGLENTSDLLTGGGSSFDGWVARLSAEGDFVWGLSSKPQLRPIAAVAEPDGGFTLMGGGSPRIARFDTNGGLLWARQHQPESGSNWTRGVSLVRRDAPGGGSEYFALGEGLGSSLGGFQISVMKFDDNGDVLWSHFYPVQPTAAENSASDPGAMALTADGDVLVAGITPVNFSDDPLDLSNITQNGIVFKLDGDSGDVLWATLIGYRGNPSIEAISEGPSGNIYVGGSSLHTVWTELPSMLLTKLTADGSVVDSVLVGRAPTSDPIPLGGESLYDTIYDMAWVDGQMWICGQMGIYNAGAGDIAAGSSAFTAMVSENLDISRLVIHAAPSTDSFQSIRPTDHGILVSGFSNSFHPWPMGAADQADFTPRSLLTLMLPWEGRMRFHDASTGRQAEAGNLAPMAGTFFMTPRVRATSQYTIETNQALFPGIGQASLTESASLDSTVLKEPYNTTSSVLSLNPTFFTPEDFKSLEFVPESLITDYATFLQYYQLDPVDNADGDPFDAGAEFFLGTSPVTPDWGVVEFSRFVEETTQEPMLRFTLTRSLMAAPALPAVLASATMEDFLPKAGVGVFAEPFDAERERLYLEFPVPADREFYQLAFPE